VVLLLIAGWMSADTGAEKNGSAAADLKVSGRRAPGWPRRSVRPKAPRPTSP
jgi:hypothetical protein